MIKGTTFDRFVSPLGKYLHQNFAQNLGIANSRRISQAYNRLRYGRQIRKHRHEYENNFEALLEENAMAKWDGAPPVMKDGYAFDRSHSLPILDNLLEQTGRIIEERGGRKHSIAQQPFFRSLQFPGDIERNPAFLNFVVSSPVLRTVGNHLGTVPVLSKTMPPGLRMMESNEKFDPEPDGPYRESQLFHLDLHDCPMVYVIVLLEDVVPECGPWSFLPASASEEAQKKLKYQKRGVPYRVTDETMYSLVDEKELVVFTGKKGDVLFIDSSRCFHYGSRHSVVPRFMMMYALTSPLRGDMTRAFMRPNNFIARRPDARLWKMVLGPEDAAPESSPKKGEEQSEESFQQL